MHAADYARVTSAFLEQIDPEHVYFSADDVRGFKTTYSDKAVKGHLSLGDIREAHALYTLYRERVRERTSWVEAQLTKWNISDDDVVQFSALTATWLPSTELESVWENKLRREWMINRLRGLAPDAATHTLLRNYQIRRDAMALSDERVEEMLLNCFTHLFDSHSSYFSPSSWGRAVGPILNRGIGAALVLKNGLCVFSDIIPGGSAALSGKVRPGDYLISVEDQHHEMVDIIGMPLAQIVDMVSGPEGSTVSIALLHEETGQHEFIRLERKSPPRQAVHLRTFIRRLSGPNERAFTLGLVEIPSLYGPDLNNNQPGCSADLEVAIDALNAAGAQGVVVDLRGNGGGFLDEAINCAGVFVGEEPVVRVRNRRGEVRVDKPTHPSRRYDKPVIALVDEGTASGAEIIAQSLRDFDQALIVGSNTAGKGNVQSVVLLSALSNGLKNVKTGAAKITVQNFFTADGSEAEGRCIQPDITLPGIPFLQRYESTQISNHGTGTTLPNLLRSPIPADAERRARLLSNSGKRQKAETDLLYLTKWSARAYHASSPSSGNLQSLEKSIASRIKEKVQCLAEGKALANGAAPLIEIDPSNTASNKVDHSDIAEEFSDLPWIPSIDPALNESFRVLADSID